MSHIAEDVRAAARCDGCGNIYTVTIFPEEEVRPIGVPTCRGCGDSKFTIFGEHSKDLIQTDE